MNKLASQFEKISTVRNLLFAMISSIIIVAVMGYLTQVWVYDVYGGANMPDTNLWYSYDDLLAAFTTLGSDGLKVWSQVHLLDLLFPLAYSFALTIGITMEVRRIYPENERLRLLALIPLLGAIADYAENALVASQIAVYPNLSTTVVSIASLVTTTKWILLGIAFGIVFVLLLLVLIKSIKK